MVVVSTCAGDSLFKSVSGAVHNITLGMARR